MEFCTKLNSRNLLLKLNELKQSRACKLGADRLQDASHVVLHPDRKTTMSNANIYESTLMILWIIHWCCSTSNYCKLTSLSLCMLNASIKWSSTMWFSNMRRVSCRYNWEEWLLSIDVMASVVGEVKLHNTDWCFTSVLGSGFYAGVLCKRTCRSDCLHCKCCHTHGCAAQRLSRSSVDRFKKTWKGSNRPTSYNACPASCLQGSWWPRGSRSAWSWWVHAHVQVHV